MSDLRTAAQQALEALEFPAVSFPVDRHKAAAALRAALVEDAMQKFTDVNQELEAALAEPVLNPAPGYCKHCKQYTIEEPLPAGPVQEPVAYSVGRTLHWHEGKGVNDAQLYLAPPQRKPLTEEEIKECERQAMVNGSLPFEQRVFFARAIERAHGITS